MRIAIIGTGISGMAAAYWLYREHDITVFEANDQVGGHTNTVTVEQAGHCYEVDTGFIVFNDWTYPNLIALFNELGVASQPTTMSFAVRCEQTGLEYNGNTLNTLFAQRRNLFRPSFYRMLADILRFNREAPTLLAGDDHTLTLGDYLQREGYGRDFIDYYIIPMGAAIWSARPDIMGSFPARNFIQFFYNHGLLNVRDRPQWRVVQGGSRQYVTKLIAPFQSAIRCRCPVVAVGRRAGYVTVQPLGSEEERFDAVVMATHSDQALALLSAPTQQERDILGAIPYQPNEAVLHTDIRLLPRRRLAWAAWNYRLVANPGPQVPVTYNMNILQNLSAPEPFCVTLNDSNAIDPERILYRTVYHHPVYTPESMAARQRHHEINGADRIWYCGAYWGYGFHEDGLNSALKTVVGLQQREAA